MWANFRKLTEAIGRFDDGILARLFGLDADLDDDPPDLEPDIDPVQADAETLASAGWGTDEDYFHGSDEK